MIIIFFDIWIVFKRKHHYICKSLIHLILTMTGFRKILTWFILPCVLLGLIVTAVISFLFSNKNETPGHHLAAEYYSDTVRITDADTGQEKLILLVDDSQTVSCVAISPDGSYVSAGTLEGRVIVWDTWIGHKENSFEAGGAVKELSFDRKGTRVTALLEDGSQTEWKVEDEEP